MMNGGVLERGWSFERVLGDIWVEGGGGEILSLVREEGGFLRTYFSVMREVILKIDEDWMNVGGEQYSILVWNVSVTLLEG